MKAIRGSGPTTTAFIHEQKVGVLLYREHDCLGFAGVQIPPAALVRGSGLSRRRLPAMALKQDRLRAADHFWSSSVLHRRRKE